MKNKLTQIISLTLVSIFLFPQSVGAINYEIPEVTPSVDRKQIQETITTIKEQAQEIKQQLQQSRTDVQSALDAYRNAVEDQKFAMLQQYGDELIEKRLNSIVRAKERIQNMERISEEDKAAILANLDAAYNGLSALDGQVGNLSDLEDLKTLIQSVFEDYRVYMVELPRDRGLQAASWASYVIGQRTPVVMEKVEKAIARYKADGYDTTEIEVLYADLQAKVTEIEGYIEAAKQDFQGMDPNDVTAAQQYLESGKENLADVKQAIIEAKIIVAEIVKELRELAE